jgi:SAM-dependent methyltransferase
MNKRAWQEIHSHYKASDWIDKPSLFAEIAISYFPKSAHILELGAGQGQDSRYFAEHGFTVVSTDLEDSALELNKSKIPENIKSKIEVQKLDLRGEFPFNSESFDVVYAHLSLHYFGRETMYVILNQITRVLKPGGIVAFFVNSTSDPEFGTGKQIESELFQIDGMTKRYFSLESARSFFAEYYDVILLDNFGETYKDAAKGVHNLIRFIGSKPVGINQKNATPCVGAILERNNGGTREVYIQTRWKPGGDPKYSGTLEFPIGRLDVIYENIFDTLAHEIESESGLRLTKIIGESRTDTVTPQKDDAAFGFKPFCCVQQLKEGKPWIGFIFICEVDGSSTPKAQLSEARDARWISSKKLQNEFEKSPEKFFTLQYPAWEYYFKQKR